MIDSYPNRRPWLVRSLTAAGFIVAGANHFRNAHFYRQIIPPQFPNPAALVAVSGAFEIAGGVGLFVAPLRRPAAWGLMALLIAVYPANIYMAVHPEITPEFPRWALWARLPLQPVLVAIVWFAGLARSERVSLSENS